MKKALPILLLVLSVIVILYSCTKNDYLPAPQKTSLNTADLNTNNPVFALGRVLFYDKNLSINSNISCGSCHQQRFAFSDNQEFSKGFQNKLTGRNTPPIQNLGIDFFGKQDIGSNDVDSSTITSILLANEFPSSSGLLFWDGRESFLNNMVLKPILNHVEMGMSDFSMIEKRVRDLPYYEDLFQRAFSNPEININKISQAITSFCESINSTSSKFDQRENITLNTHELNGMQLFQNKYNCVKCHTIDIGNYMISITKFADIGLDKNPLDIGRGAVTGNSSDRGKFKVPSLRNVELTAPYMHDGRFKTLDEVLDHYSHGIQNDPNLDEILKDSGGQAKAFNISEEDKKDIIAFLKTLTDYNLIFNKQYSDPFISKN